MLIRRERAEDAPAVRALTVAAFRGVARSRPYGPEGEPVEAALLDWLRADVGWLPALSLVACGSDGAPVGHVVCTRGAVGAHPALGLGPLSVEPARQGEGFGSALVRAAIATADGAGEPLIALLGEPAFYGRFGFRPARLIGVEPPDPGWGDLFQARTLSAYEPMIAGRFAYAAPFARL